MPVIDKSIIDAPIRVARRYDLVFSREAAAANRLLRMIFSQNWLEARIVRRINIHLDVAIVRGQEGARRPLRSNEAS